VTINDNHKVFIYGYVGDSSGMALVHLPDLP